MASLAEKLRAKSAEIRTTFNSSTTNFAEKKADITTFFNYMKNDAEDKMNIRSEKGYNSANILEYTYAEYFFIDENNEVIRTPKYQKPTVENGKAYRIFEAIRTTEFKEMLSQYEKDLGEGMELAMWWPGGNINVIEAIWGPTKYHRRTKNNTKYSTEMEISTDTMSNEMEKVSITDETTSVKTTYSSMAKK